MSFVSLCVVLIPNYNSPFMFFHQAFFSANAAAQASRKSSPRVTNEAVQKAVSAFNSFAFPIDMLLKWFCTLN